MLMKLKVMMKKKSHQTNYVFLFFIFSWHPANMHVQLSLLEANTRVVERWGEQVRLEGHSPQVPTDTTTPASLQERVASILSGWGESWVWRCMDLSDGLDWIPGSFTN